MMIQIDAWTPERLEEANDRLRPSSPREILGWAYETFGDDIALATGFGPSGTVLMHLVSQLRPGATIFYLDTGLLFPETYRMRDRLEEVLGIRIARVEPEQTVEEQAETHGEALWERDPDHCCHLRKVRPLQNFLREKQAWITGLRRDQARTRARAEVVEWDFKHGLVKLNPVVHWTEEDIWGYIRLHELPYNELHDRGYPSVGCVPCTRAVRPGEDPRAGRWSGHGKLECGIHAPAPLRRSA